MKTQVYDKYIVIFNSFWSLDYTHCLQWCRPQYEGSVNEHPDGDDFQWFYGCYGKDNEVVAVE